MMRRVYYLLCEKWALSDLEHRRLKVARFNDLNDPFELLGPELPEQRYRQRFYRWRAKVTSRFGLLCFSKTWRNPVLWSHYGDRHKGLCLGFDIPANELHDVRYLGERSKPTELLPEKAEPGPLFLIKFKDWAYENESRRIIRLAEARKDGEHYFWPFGEDLALREIIVGARCKVTQKSLQRILKGRTQEHKADKGSSRVQDVQRGDQPAGLEYSAIPGRDCGPLCQHARDIGTPWN